MEPHATRRACGTAGGLTLHDSNQGAHGARRSRRRGVRARARARPRRLARTSAAASAPRARRARTSCSPRWPRRLVDRPVKLALTRQQMFALRRLPHADDPARPPRRRRATAASPRSPTRPSSRPRRCASSPSRPRVATRMMYAAPEPPHAPPARRARRPDAVMDARARRVPGHVRARVGDRRAGDRLRPRPDRAAHPQRARASTRRRASRSPAATSSPACARAPSGSAGSAARRARAATAAGWSAPASPPRPTPPTARRPRRPRASRPTAATRSRIDATDIGTGARTVLTQIAADALGVARRARAARDRRLALPAARPSPAARWARRPGAPRSSRPARALREQRRRRGCRRGHRRATIEARTTQLLAPRVRRAVRRGPRRRRHRRGARPALLGVFAVGRVINPQHRALAVHRRHDDGPRRWRCTRRASWTRGSATTLNHDLAAYHVAANADVEDIDAAWIDEDDPQLNPMGSKGIGEIGIVGTAAAVANAVYHATGRARARPADPARPRARSRRPRRRARSRRRRAPSARP